MTQTYADPGGPRLSMRNVSKRYYRGRHELSILQDVSLDVHAGELVALVGQHGAGKTTLLKIAGGLETPDEGAILLDGVSLSRSADTQDSTGLDPRIGWVSSTQATGEIPILDSIATPLLATLSRRDAYANATAALATVGIEDCARERGEDLLDRERILASLAHAIARSPMLLLVDEPATALDMSQTDDVTWLLRDLAIKNNTAILMTAADVPAALRAHHITMLAGGRLSKSPRGEVLDFPTKDSPAQDAAS